MQGHVDEIEYLKNHGDEEENEEASGDSKDQILKLLKSRLFSLFFRLNTLKVAIPIHYHMVMIAIEGLQLLTLVLNDGSYNKLGPYDSDSPWNLSQTNWLIDVCWVFRVDRYLRGSITGFMVLLGIWGFLLASLVGIGVFIAIENKNFSSIMSFLLKILKALITLMTNLLFIPIIDTLAFAIRCSIATDDNCLDLPVGYQFMMIYVAGSVVYFGVIILCSMLYFDFCQICGGFMGKPHCRLKLLRLSSYVGLIFSYYFITTAGKVILFLIVCLALGIIISYAMIQYVPYYNLRMCHIRLGAIVSFTSAVFCMIIGEFFKSTDQTNSSVTMLFYFLTPCLIQITQLAMNKRCKNLAEKKIQQLTNPYQVEIKVRMLVLKLEEAKSKYAKSIYGANNEEENEELKALQAETFTEIETVYNEAFKKFPNAEFLYLWSGLIQLHIFENYILSMVQCFKGTMIASKLDSQYMLYHFRKTSESFYKAHMKDDAYDYELFEKAFQNAQKNDESVTRSQFYFWAELESKAPKIQKLSKLAGETAKMIIVAKGNYQKLLKLNSKNTQALRMYGWFLSSLNNFSEMGQRYLNKAEMQEEAQQKNLNANVMNSLNQPLSFFDADNAIIRVSGDFETLGEIQKANASACQLLGYLSAELIGRNISLIIPSPFSESHDEYIKKFHESGNYSIIDNQHLILYFANKNNNIFEGRLLVKVVPNDGQPPFLSAIIKPTNPKYEIVIMNKDWVITGYSQHCSEIFDLGNTKNSEQKIYNIITKFEDNKEAMMSEDGYDYTHEHEKTVNNLKLRLSELKIGEQSAHLLKVEVLDKQETKKGDYTRQDEKESKSVSTVLPNSNIFNQKSDPVNHMDINLELDSTDSNTQQKSKSGKSPPTPPNMGGPLESSESQEISGSSEEESSEEDSGEEDSSAEDLSGSGSDLEATKVVGISGIADELDSLKGKKFAGLNVPDEEEKKYYDKKQLGENKPPSKDLINLGSKGSNSKSSQSKSSNSKSEESEESQSKSQDSKSSDESGKNSYSKSGSEEENGEEEEEEEEESEKSSSENDEDHSEGYSHTDPKEEDHSGLDGQSAHSSSKSMNSSMASLAQFNKSIKALVAYEFSRTRKYVLRFKLTLILTIIVLIVTSIMTFQIITNSVDFNEKLSHYVNLVGLLRMYTQSIAYYTRIISFMDFGYVPNTDRELFFQWLASDTTDMHNTNLVMYTKYGLLSDADQVVYTNEEISTWLLEGKTVREIQSNLFDATSNFILQAYLLNVEYNSTLVNLTNRRAFYLYRNGNGETLQYINHSAIYYVDAALNDLESERIVAIMLILVSILLLCFCAGFAVIPAIRVLEKSKKEIWEIFFEIPGYVCRVMKAKCSDRLTILNEQANMELEELNGDDQKDDEDKAKDEGKRNDSKTSKGDRNGDKSKKKKNVVEQKRVLAYDPKQRKIIVIKLACFFIISVVYFYLIYYTGFESVGSILQEEPPHVNWASRRRQLSRTINMWVTETLFENITGVGYKYVVPMGQDVGTGYTVAQIALDELDYVENSLIFGNSDERLSSTDSRSSKHDNILFDNACAAPLIRNLEDCTTAGDGCMMQGLHSALGTYTTLGRTLLLQIENLKYANNYTLSAVQWIWNGNDMTLFRNLDNHYLYDPLTYSSDLYESDYKDQQQQMTVWQNLLMALYAIFSLLFFFFVYNPMIHKIGQDTKNAWSMCTLIPQEYQEDFKKLSAAIKERRDNFKWR
ncbi:unnamed protein product [Blepharisma stoltei]|uniref:PAS domain-containing protein n=1 Tax=Blepharisma stoltei TaxID=1481888 RepID=A0AAU9JAJ4_9CILI|nr:unnamed protein product [Blepharisma stoltei]